MYPPVGAFPLSITVPVVISPEASVAGLKDTFMTTGGTTVSVPGRDVPLGSVAVTITFVLAATGDVAALKVPLLAAPAILKLTGTVAALVLLLISMTVKPAAGAGPFSVTVPTEPTPPVTELGLNVTVLMVAGLTASMPPMLLAPTVAVTVTMSVMATPVVVAVNVCEVLVAAIVTLPGTVTAGSPLFNVTVIPPAGAAWLIVTVPVELVPPVTAAGLKLTPDTVSEGTTVAFPVTIVEPVLAVTITCVELPTEPAVTIKVWLLVFTATTTFAGTGSALVLLLIRVTVSPPAGAFPLIITVPVVI